jgi:hypothetical protein
MNEFIQAISWEHLAFLLAIIFMFLFRSPLQHLITRITKIDKGGVTTTPLQPEAQRKQINPEAVQELLNAVDKSIVLDAQEKLIEKDLEAKNLSIEGDTVRILIRHLAGTQILLGFERLHTTIFGSQISLLKKLNELAGQGRPREFAQTHFKNLQQRYPEPFDRWSYDQYMGYLFSLSLVVAAGDQIHITNLGVEYLTWIVRNGRTEDLPL